MRLSASGMDASYTLFFYEGGNALARRCPLYSPWSLIDDWLNIRWCPNISVLLGQSIFNQSASNNYLEQNEHLFEQVYFHLDKNNWVYVSRTSSPTHTPCPERPEEIKAGEEETVTRDSLYLITYCRSWCHEVLQFRRLSTHSLYKLLWPSLKHITSRETTHAYIYIYIMEPVSQ